MVPLQFAILGSTALFITLMLVAIMAIAAYFRQFALGMLAGYSIVSYIVIVGNVEPYNMIAISLGILVGVAGAFQIYGFTTGGGV